MREHGGSISADVLPAGGAAFSVFLPIASDQQSPAAPATDSGLSLSPLFRAASEALKGRSVLVLDDEESLRMLLKEGLSVHGLEVDCAATATEALQFARREAYDVLLCDLNLTGGGAAANGREVAQQIVAASGSRKPVVIFMTGDLLQGGATSSKDTYRLQKPFRISDVLAMLREIFSPANAEKVQK